MSDAPMPPIPPSPPEPAAGFTLPPPLPYAPPTVPGALQRPVTRPAWPMVIGIISIVFGSGGVLAGVWGIVSTIFMSKFEGMFPTQGDYDPFAAMAKWQGPLVAANVVGLLVAGLLLAGGILLTMRRPVSSPTLVWWATLKMIVSLALIAMTLAMQHEQMQAMQAQMAASGGAAMASSFTNTMMIFGAVIGIAWAWALPVFMLIWFTRAGVRKTVHEWRQETAAGYR